MHTTLKFSESFSKHKILFLIFNMLANCPFHEHRMLRPKYAEHSFTHS